MKEPKIMVVPLPTTLRVVHEGSPVADMGKRQSLIEDVLREVGAVMDKHPEVAVAFLCMYTPRPDDISGPYDESHTAVLTGPDKITEDMLRDALVRAIPGLIGMHMDLPTLMKQLMDVPEKPATPGADGGNP